VYSLRRENICNSRAKGLSIPEKKHNFIKLIEDWWSSCAGLDVKRLVVCEACWTSKAYAMMKKFNIFILPTGVLVYGDFNK